VKTIYNQHVSVPIMYTNRPISRNARHTFELHVNVYSLKLPSSIRSKMNFISLFILWSVKLHFHQSIISQSIILSFQQIANSHAQFDSEY